MSYTLQISILESKLEQLKQVPFDTDHTSKVLQIQSELKKLRRLEWEENYERLKLEEER